MTTLRLTPNGSTWDTDDQARPTGPDSLEQEAERLRRRLRPSVDDLLSLERVRHFSSAVIYFCC